MLVQLRLRREAPSVAARRLQLFRELEDVIAAALERELGPEHQLAGRLTAASLMAGLNAIEDAAAAQLSDGGRAFSQGQVDGILDATIEYVQAGLAALVGR